ncbi:MAG: PEP-CTERM sorting domain-containing protein [Phycisphaerae bacterium]|nr:PEP-CTERM sorting domain-containing protein [Phycisphaerae bacterium]
MKKALCLATILLVAGFANAELVPLQLVASDYAMPVGNQPAGIYVLGDSSVLNGGADPVLDTAGASVCQTYNIWANLGLAPDAVWNGLGFSIHTTGDVTASATLDILTNDWNVHGATGRWLDSGMDFVRWNAGSDNYADDTGDVVTMAAVQEAGLGGLDDNGIGATSVYDWDAFEYTLGYRGDWFLLGTITVCGTYGDVYLDYQGTNFIGGEKGDSEIFYGYAASGIQNLDANLGVVADAPFVSFIPEPASLILLALSGLVLRRR